MEVFLSEIFAVDPGLNGAWACLDFKGSFIKAGEIPRFAKHINGVEFANIIRLYRPKQIIIEQVSAMPKQGVTSVFTFGVAYGTVIGIATGARIPLHFVIPRWTRLGSIERRLRHRLREMGLSPSRIWQV